MSNVPGVHSVAYRELGPKRPQFNSFSLVPSQRNEVKLFDLLDTNGYCIITPYLNRFEHDTLAWNRRISGQASKDLYNEHTERE